MSKKQLISVTCCIAIVFSCVIGIGSTAYTSQSITSKVGSNAISVGSQLEGAQVFANLSEVQYKKMETANALNANFTSEKIASPNSVSMSITASENVQMGKMFTVEHSFSGLDILSNPIYVMQFDLNYDSQAMTCVSIKPKVNINGVLTYNEVSPGHIIVLYDSNSSEGIAVKAQGLFTAQFQSKANKISGEYTVGLSNILAFDEKETKINCTATNAVFKINLAEKVSEPTKNKKDKVSTAAADTSAETKVTTEGNITSVTPSAKLTTLESGKAIVKTEISEAAVLNSPTVRNATVQNPAKISIVVPVSDTVAQLQSANVTKVQINVAIPSSVISNDKISIDDIKLDNAVFTAAKAANKDVIVSVQKENNAELYAVIISGKVLKAKANTEVAPNFAANVNALVQGSTAIRFKHNCILPSGAATLRVTGFKSNAVYHVFYQNPKTGYAEPIMANNTYKADINGNVVFPIASLSNYEICTSKPSNAYPVISDTTDTVNVAKDGTYTYKMTVSKNVIPKFTLGNGKAFQTRVVKKGNDYYLSIKSLSHSGDSTGVYCILSGTNVVALGSAKIK